MKIFHAGDRLINKSIVMLGMFDGLHLGHMSLVRKALELKKREGLDAVLYTFDRNPKDYKKTLLSDADKTGICEKYCIDGIYFERFDDDFRKMSVEDFIDKVIKGRLNAAFVVVGNNFHFGFKGAGTVRDLENRDFGLFVMPELEIGGKTVSSSAVRSFLEDGDVKSAAEFLGYNYFLKGNVVHGRGVGRTFGICTANIELSDEFVIPKDGVYATTIEFGGKSFESVTNIGKKPTFGDLDRTIEVHIPDFTGDIYDEEVRLVFLERIRGEIKFSSKEELAEQIEKDIDAARCICKEG